ncbi:MAG: peptide deformylase [Bacilli bacterium]|nr:peptide deformylase [Bacilli bacterium]
MKNLPNIKILDESDKRLHQKSEEVTFPLDKETIKTIYDCLDYLEMSQDEEMAEKYDLRAGMGLSFCQIGIMKRIFVVSEDFGDRTFGRYIVINPKVISHSEELIYVGEGEGCLSVNRPTEGIVPRYARMRIKAYDENGCEYEIRVREDISVAFQHELDHLDGILFTDKIDKKNPFKDRNKMREI